MFQNLRKPVLFMVGALVLYALIGFVIVPAVLQAKLPGMIEQATGRKASVGKINLNPFSLEFSLENFSIQEVDAQPFATFDVLSANFEGFESIRHWALTLDQVSLVKPYLKIARSAAGTFNFSDLIKQQPPPEQEETGGIPPFLIHNLSISAGTGVWEDLGFKKPEKETIAPIDLSISEFSTIGSDPSGMHLSFTLSSGAHLDWTGNTVIQPLQSTGVIKLDHLSLHRLWKLFLKNQVPFELKDGTAKMTVAYEFGEQDGGFRLAVNETKIGFDQIKLTGNKQGKVPDVSVRGLTFSADVLVEQDAKNVKVNVGRGSLSVADVSAKGTPQFKLPDIEFKGLEAGLDSALEFNEKGLKYAVKQAKATLSRFRLAEPSQKDALIEIPKLAVQGIRVDSAKQRIDVSSIATENARIKAWLAAGGTLNYQTLFGSASTPSAPPAAVSQGAPGKPWRVRLDKASLKNYQISFSDRMQDKPVDVDLTALDIGLENVSNEPGTDTQVRLRSRVNESGEIKLTGEAALSPVKVELAVDINEIGLKTLQPYLERYVRLDLVDGDLSTQGRLSVAFVESEPLSLKYQGNAKIAHLLTRDQIQNKDFVKWNTLELGKISVDLQQQAYRLEEVVFDQPYGRIIIKKDGTTNIHDILLTRQPGQKAATAPEPAESRQKAPTFTIGKIRVEQGMSDFADYSLILPFITQMNSLNGTLIGLSSAQDATAKLALTGKVYDLASVEIAGRYQIDSGDSVVNLKFKDMPLPLVTPYMAEFAGYKIEKGQMSLDLSYTISKGKLEAQNNMFIDQFTLGEKVENPDAVSLPLNLAIALLKDSDGKINLDLPISGSLEDPEFSISGLVFKALGNLLKKIVTSPFHALASLVGGNRDLSEIRFSPGSAELELSEKVKLSKLAEALQSRPSLRLEIKGAAYQEQDWPAMRADALKDQLKKRKARELKAEGTKIRSEYVELSEEDYKKLLAKEFIEKFPLLAEYSFFGTPQLKNSEAGDFYEIARQKLEAILEPDRQRLENLALLRASRIAKYIIEQGGIANDRVFILATELDPKQKEPGIFSTLSLDVAS
ncbi:MAG: DUF748 domain-containing protein [Gammaproteobacteria bacterium]